MGSNTPPVHVPLSAVRLREKFLCRKTHVHGGHHNPMLVIRIHEKGHVWRDETPVNDVTPHGNTGHVFIAAYQHDVRKVLSNFHESDLGSGHG